MRFPRSRWPATGAGRGTVRRGTASRLGPTGTGTGPRPRPRAGGALALARRPVLSRRDHSRPPFGRASLEALVHAGHVARGDGRHRRARRQHRAALAPTPGPGRAVPRGRPRDQVPTPDEERFSPARSEDEHPVGEGRERGPVGWGSAVGAESVAVELPVDRAGRERRRRARGRGSRRARPPGSAGSRPAGIRRTAGGRPPGPSPRPGRTAPCSGRVSSRSGDARGTRAGT